MSLIIVSSLLATFIASCYLYVTHIYSHWKRRGIPFVQPSFPFGNFGPLFKGHRTIGENCHDLYFTSNAPVLGIYAALRPALLIRDPKITKDILIKDFQCFRDRGFRLDAIGDPLAANLFTSDDKWKEMRVKLTPAFTPGKVRAMFDSIVKCSKPMEEYIGKYANTGKEIEIRETLSRFTADVIASIGFGLDVNSFENPNNEFREKARRIYRPFIRNAIRLDLSFISPFLSKLFKIRFGDKDVTEFLLDIMRQTIDYRVAKNIVRNDFFQLLMKLRKGEKIQQEEEEEGGGEETDGWNAKGTSNEESLSLNDMAAQSYIFIVAGDEPSSGSMTFCMYELAKNKDIQHKVYEEIKSVLQKNDGNLTYESLNDMKYLDACIDETLRKHPPFDILNRECTTDYRVAGTDIVIEKGTTLYFSITAPHYDPQYYDEPDKFMPERFIDDPSLNKNSSQKNVPYLAWGDGPRNCIAIKMSKIQLKIAIASLLRKFAFELDAQHANGTLNTHPGAIVRIPIGGIHLKVKAR